MAFRTLVNSSEQKRHEARDVRGPGNLILQVVENADETRQGDIGAYNLLVSRWEKRVFNYLLRIVGNRENAFNLTKDAFLKGYQNIRKLDDPARFAPWLFQIAHNVAHSGFRKRRPEVDSHEVPEATAGISCRTSPTERSLAVTAALERLNPEQKEAIVLKIYQGFKFEEMSEILNLPVATIRNRLYSALDILKAELAPR
jgi:RNA polymerase sigma-70 factor (ECF subfamily)